MNHQPQLLLVWNPLIEPRTVKVHVDTLRRVPGDTGARVDANTPPRPPRDHYVWWGRIYQGSTKMQPALLRRKWKHVFDLYRTARKEGRDLVVFVTDFHSLHALRVDYVKAGPALPDDDRRTIPDYYFEEERRVGLWFRVRDIRALTHYQLRTLEYFREMMGPVKGSFALGSRLPYDPYAAFKYDYPIIVDGPPARKLFDADELARRSPGARGFADLRETVFPPDLQMILEELEGRFEFLWDSLRDNTRIFLACARLVEQRYEGHERFDFSAAVCELAKAMEAEVIDGLVAKLLRLPEEIWDSEELEDLRRGRAQSRMRSLGSAGNILRTLGGSGPPRELATLEALGSSGSPWMSWFEEFVRLRNGALHSEMVDHDRFRQVWGQVLSPEAGTGLLPVVRAQTEVGELLREGGRG